MKALPGPPFSRGRRLNQSIHHLHSIISCKFAKFKGSSSNYYDLQHVWSFRRSPDLASPFSIRTTGSLSSLCSHDQVHAFYTPNAIYTVPRFPVDLSRDLWQPRFWHCLDLTMRQQRFGVTCLPDQYLFDFISNFSLMLTTTALYGSRLRWFGAHFLEIDSEGPVPSSAIKLATAHSKNCPQYW